MENKYEAVFIIKNPDDEENIKKNCKKIENIIKENNFNIFKTEKIGKKKLAYDIKGEKYGYYLLLNFETKETKPNSLDKVNIGINTIEDVIKHIILKLEN